MAAGTPARALPVPLRCQPDHRSRHAALLLPNDDFAPHWQWLHHEFGKLPEALELGPGLDRFLAGVNAGECTAVVPEIIDILTARLADKGWIEPGHHSMQRAADEIKARISDRTIQNMY